MATLKKRRSKDQSSSESMYDPSLQIYDSSFKEWIKQQPERILPLLLEGAHYVEELDVERVQPTLRVDRVYKIMYRGQLHILHLEFESGNDTEMAARLLLYHAILYSDYGLPIISVIIYPFRVTMAKSPWQELSGDEAILTFHFKVLPLFSLEAESIVQQHLACMYPLLPTMKGANRELIEQAMAELAALYREDEKTLSQQLVWMELLLERVETFTPEEKQQVKRSLSMYDPLWENHPKVKQIKTQAKIDAQREANAISDKKYAEKYAEKYKADMEKLKADLEKNKREAEARARRKAEQRAQQAAELAKREAEAKAELAKREAEARAEREAEQRVLQALRDTALTITKARFPALAEMAREKSSTIESTAILQHLIEQISLAPNEEIARWLLNPSAA